MFPINRMIILGTGVVAAAALLDSSAGSENTPEDVVFAAKALGLENEGHRELAPFCDRAFDFVYGNIPADFLPFDFDCTCKINLRERAIGFGCNMLDHYCLDGSDICAIGSAQATLTFQQDIWLEFDLNVDLNGTIPVLDIPVPDIDVALETCRSNGLSELGNVATLCSCEALIDSTACTSCDICGTKDLGVALNCSNVVDILDFSENCIGINEMLEN